MLRLSRESSVLAFLRLLHGTHLGFPGSSDGKESACNAGRPGFNPWVGKIPLRREWQPTPGGLRSMGSQRVRHDWATNTHTWTHLGEMLDSDPRGIQMSGMQRSLTTCNPTPFIQGAVQQTRIKHLLCASLSMTHLRLHTGLSILIAC